MENSHIQALKPLQNPNTFPPPRRRPLMSETCRTLLQILSYCPSTDSATDKQKLGASEDDNGGSNPGKQNEVDKLVDHHLIRSENLLVNAPAHKESDMVVQQGLVGGNGGNLHSGYEDFTGAQMKVDLDPSNRMSDAIEGEKGDSRTNDINYMNCLVDKTIKPFELDEELDIDGAYAAIDSCFGADTITELSQPAQITGEMEHGLRLKEMEFETLISSAGMIDSSQHISVDKEMEEGELPEGLMVFDDSDNDICNDVGDEKEKEGAKNENNSFSGGEFIRKFGEDSDHDIKKGFSAKDYETRKVRVYDSILDSGDVSKEFGGAVKLDHPAGSQYDATSTENAKQNKYLIEAAEDADIDKKRKKRGPLTKEKRAKKKAKKRIKRAEKNRKLGIKRLKLAPQVLKPKVVSYCRHYINGRCSEGEKCKFSHDTIPLTKSKPCCHFARKSCMKGVDCPFDHQLFKYPCNNIATNGNCSRGADCSFSHEGTAKTAAAKSSASNLELMAPSVPTNSNSGNSVIPVSTFGMSQKHVNSPFGSSRLMPGKSVKQTALEPVPKPAPCIPKGVTFLSHGKSLQDSTKKREEASSSFKEDTSISKPDSLQKPNGVVKGAVMSAPRGKNFLIFGRSPSAEPSDDTTSPFIQGRQSVTDKASSETPIRESSRVFSAGQLNQSIEKGIFGISNSSKTPFLVDTPGSIQKALQSTLSFAAKFDLGVKYGMSISSPSNSFGFNHTAESSKNM